MSSYWASKDHWKRFQNTAFPQEPTIFSLYNSVHQFKSQPRSTCFGPSWAGAMKWAYPPRLFYCYLVQWPHILTRNDLWQLINSSEYKPLSKEVLTNLYFSSSHTGNFLIILTREMFKENATNSSEICGQCFPNKCTNVHQTAISFQQYRFPFTLAGAPETGEPRHLGFPLHSSNPHFWPSPYKKENVLYGIPAHTAASRGLFTKDSIGKHLLATRLLRCWGGGDL